MRIIYDPMLARHDRWTEGEKDVWNCAGESRPDKRTWRFMDAGGIAEAVEKCPICHGDPALRGAYGIWSLYKDWRRFKVLPEAGGSLDQPAIVMRAFRIFDSEVRRIEAYNREHN